MLWLIPIGIIGLSGAAAWLSRPKTPQSAPPSEGAGALRQPSNADECATLLEEVARRARRLSLLPASITQELFTWVPHANGANVRALSAGGRTRLPPRWRSVKTINGTCMGEPVAIELYRPDNMGTALPAPSWISIGALLSGEGPALAITGSLGPATLRQLQADDRWLLLTAGANASASPQAPPTAARPTATATPSRPPATRPSSGTSTALPAVSNAIKSAAQGGPLSTMTNLVSPAAANMASDDASRKLVEMADAVRKAKGLPPAPVTAPNESRGSLAAVTKSIATVTSTAIQQTEAAKARARAQAAVAAVQKGASS